ncbi:hypothetical protein CKM354_000319700 [Cercospora kikuchii]|uniref:Lysine-specific metallo-endopeptidase domain-containing protein n=1 Tax=Cercospora kikuchii TaxID=84275 RepID=A0A9P3CG54_9PEZI|nr:uncharacterized protein CKM354_000319700 [Cercospora kikuchii]GIZ39830.1 hypothetical protein CKM354_000319700 [Cercospora kikuchii]
MANTGGNIFFDNDSDCEPKDKEAIQTAVWDAHTLAFFASNFPNTPTAGKGSANAMYWMGPDWASQKDRIAGNLKRIYEFKTRATSESTYITMSCKDTRNECHKIIENKAVGGYAWTYSGWFGYYHYITLCPTFFKQVTLDTKLSQVEDELKKGVTKMASDASWLDSTGRLLLHEMMHTRIADGGIEPHITDEGIFPKGHGDPNRWAYGPGPVHRLAHVKLTNGGGVTRASTNADSYAWLADSAWWWDTTGVFPKADGKDLDDLSGDDGSSLIMQHIDLGNVTDPTGVDFTALYAAAANGPSAFSPIPQPPVAPTTPETPPEEPENICGAWYKVFFDHFEILGKDFAPAKLGDNGSGLKDQLQDCGALTKWEFKPLTGDPNGYQWSAKGRLPIGTKSCIGNAVKDIGGDADGCKGAG